MRRGIVASLAGLGLFVALPAAAQSAKLRPEISTAVASATVPAGSTTEAAVRVRLPEGVHVQSDKPRDPALVPFTLTIAPPDGVSIEGIAYPTPSEIEQPGRAKPLLVFSGDVRVAVRLAIAPDAPAGPLTVPATLRYQGCTEQVCFPPSRAAVEWTVTVVR